LSVQLGRIALALTMQCVHSFGQGEVGYSHYKECTFWIAALFFDKIMDNFDVYAYMEDVWA